ncbi:hypothetical protein [Salinicola aestuarinus]|uniref:hypothetical protein n=1 Tax=Salinicola aestuarinus TaxID=1949082 RepID=UPI001300A1C7|nr:hypothetical protein [Salinicola aestuarinus]
MKYDFGQIEEIDVSEHVNNSPFLSGKIVFGSAEYSFEIPVEFANGFFEERDVEFDEDFLGTLYQDMISEYGSDEGAVRYHDTLKGIVDSATGLQKTFQEIVDSSDSLQKHDFDQLGKLIAKGGDYPKYGQKAMEASITRAIEEGFKSPNPTFKSAMSDFTKVGSGWMHIGEQSKHSVREAIFESTNNHNLYEKTKKKMKEEKIKSSSLGFN